jgi:poly-gamma-glutamate capsule biosynthesis protein CapA/YwtB (metallophosphatase superfamily)
VKRLPIVTVLAVVAVAVVVAASGVFGGSPAPSPSPVAQASVGSPPASAPYATASAATSPAAAATQLPLADIPIVPVVQFRTQQDRVGRDEVVATLAGTSKTYESLELVDSEADAIFAAIGVSRPADASRLVLAKDAAKVSKDLAKNRKRLAFLRADTVGPSVRALAWGERALFGVGAVKSLAEWKLTASLPIATLPDGSAAAPFDPATTWTLVAGGDIMLDRGVAETLKIKGKGADFPFDGGTAEITSRCKDCSAFGWDLPRTRRTGNGGVVRELIEGADLAIANFENPAPDNFRYHTSGTVFSADPKLIKGLADAGIDYVGLANNHIRDAGGAGILQTIANLKDFGIRSGGAGKNIAAARKPAIMDAGEIKVAILAYDTIAKYYAANPDRPGSAIMSAKVVKSDVKKARDAGADLVIVFPHWGTEYDPTPFPGQQALARAAIDAGADIVIGNHAHWAGAMEVYKGKPIWYALGNFVFDQTWSEPTMEGITLELTFRGADLVQIHMRPHIILDKAQPNFLDPRGDGRVVMGQVFDASKGLLGW